jgi:hypothetical protein
MVDAGLAHGGDTNIEEIQKQVINEQAQEVIQKKFADGKVEEYKSKE